MRSLRPAVHQLLWPLLSSGALLGAGAWALAAVVLPWLVRGRTPGLDAAAAAIWAALACAATIGALHAGRRLGTPPTAALGAVASAVVALAHARLTAWRLRGE
jgi:hypothetical protein